MKIKFILVLYLYCVVWYSCCLVFYLFCLRFSRVVLVCVLWYLCCVVLYLCCLVLSCVVLCYVVLLSLQLCGIWWLTGQISISEIIIQSMHFIYFLKPLAISDKKSRLTNEMQWLTSLEKRLHLKICG